MRTFGILSTTALLLASTWVMAEKNPEPAKAAAVAAAPQRVVEHIEIAASAISVWEKIGDFNSLPAWHPAIEKSEIKEVKDADGCNTLPGTQRTLTLKGGEVQLLEYLQYHDDKKMTYTYKITDVDPKILPITNYVAMLTVTEKDAKHATVQWESQFFTAKGYTNEQSTDAIKGVYVSGLENLKKVVEAEAKEKAVDNIKSQAVDLVKEKVSNLTDEQKEKAIETITDKAVDLLKN